MKSVRFSRLLASTAVAAALVGLPADAQQPNDAGPSTDAQINAAAPPPPALKDIAPPETRPAASEPAKMDAPALAEPAKAEAAPAPLPPAETAPPAVKDAAAPAAPASDGKPAEKAAITPEPPKQTEKAAAPTPVSAPEEAKAPPAPPAASPAPQEAKAPRAAPAKPVVSKQAVADALRDLVTGKQFDRAVSRKPDRSGIEAYYKAHDYAPIWIDGGAANARAKAAMDTLAHAGEVGLDPADYPTPSFTPEMSADALAAAELKLTASALTYARQAQVGRISFTRVDKDISFKQEAPDPEKVLETLAAAADAGAALDSYNPPQPEFTALRKALAELRHGASVKNLEEKPVARVTVPEGRILRPGMQDERVIALRKRLDVPGDKNNPLYDDAVVEAVKAFQVSADLGPDGLAGPVTVRALNGERQAGHKPPRSPIDTIIVNMERWRWFPRDLGDPHVIVNVPDYTLTLYSHGAPYWHTKIVAGKPGKATPMISAEMKYITVNPTWNVPPSIIEKEYLPALQEDPEALDRIGLKLEQAPDGTVRIYQPPGAGNALGRIRFNFPNKFLVYQHDTPDKYLFARAKRAYSHGCMRVQNPETYAVKLLSLVEPAERYTERRIEGMYGDSEININFKKNIWVHLTYQTAFVDPDGKLQFRDDVYGRDARMIEILNGPERKVADIPVEHAPDTSAKPVKMPVGMYGGQRYDDPGVNFFEFLFGGGPPQPAYRPRGYIGPRANRDSYRYR